MHTKISSVLLSKTEEPNQPAERDYRRETMRPIISLIFVTPFLLAYELACIIADMPIRTGVDQWIHHLFSLLGIGHLVILPIVTAGILLRLHHRQKDHWSMKPSVFVGMLVESTGLGLILFFAASAYQSILSNSATESAFTSTELSFHSGWLITQLSFFGAGIYEELFFRLLLLSGIIACVKKFTSHQQLPTAIGIIFSSVLFALAHYSLLNPAGINFESTTFLFRFLASVVFCFVFLFRGFGVAVGTHVAYDILTQL